jgi:branched-chain amino acid transport system substrate-binding protein
LISRRQLLAGLGGAAIGTALESCTSGRSSADEIRIGALCELSGPSSTIGSQQALGIQFAVDEINRTGGVVGKRPGVDGRPIRLLVEDTEGKVATGLAKAKKLVDRDKVHALTGIIFSSISMAVQTFVNSEGRVPFVNAGSSNPAVAEPPACGRYTFIAEPNSRQFVLPSLYAAKRFGPRWFFIADDYSWGRLTVQLTKQAIQLGSRLEIAGEEYAPLGTTNYAPYITKAMVAKPDVIGLVIFGSGYATLLKQLKEMGAAAHIHHNFWSQVDANAAGDAVLGMTAGEAYLFDNPKAPRAAVFANAYRAKHGSWPDPAAARGYNAVEVLTLAIDHAQDVEPGAIVKALEDLVFLESVLGAFRFRDCDHLAATSMFVVEGKRDDRYQYYPAFVEEVANAGALLVPCGKTGCEALTRGS